MTTILAASYAFPPHVVEQRVVRDAVREMYAGRIPGLDQLLEIFDHSRIERRQFIRPPEWYLVPHPAEERHRIFLEEGLALAETAARDCLASAGCRPDQVGQVIFVSSTGLATPTLDAHLINRLGLPPGTSRIPVWGLGCAAGAAGISRAADFCRAWPGARVLLVALETCSLTFLAGDQSKKNLVAMSLFADGAAAALLAGDKAGGAGPRVLAGRSHLFPDSYRIMGWDFLQDGMCLVLSPKLPAMVHQELGPLVDDFLSAHGLGRGDLRHYVTHPGGARVVDACREALDLRDGQLRITEDVLRHHGNVSSASVLVVLAKWLAAGGAHEPGHGLLSAFGPGFSAELVLFQV